MAQLGSKVRVLNKDSYWYLDVGTVAAVSQLADGNSVNVRFERINKLGMNSNSFADDEILEMTGPRG